MRLALALLAAACLAAPVSASDADCTREIATAVDAALTSGPVRMTSTGTTPAGALKITGEIVPPDAMHFVFDTAGVIMEFTSLDDKAWMKAGGVWTEFSPKIAAQMTAGLQIASNPDYLARMSDPHCNGLVSIGGRDLLSYAFALREEEGSSLNRVFVDPVRKAPVRVEADLDIEGSKTSILVEYTYDPTVTVVAPAL